jgi:hypothetical protein
MRSDKERLRPLDRIDPPDVWHRATRLDPLGDVPEGPQPSWQRRVAAGTVAFAVFAGALALVFGAFDEQGLPTPSVASEPTPSVASEPTPSVASEPTPSGNLEPRDLDPIDVTTPARGNEVTSPVTIAGTADVFEATVSIEIRDQTNNVIAETFATATCGTGCRGDFSVDVRYSVGQAQAGEIRVFEVSAMDGKPNNVVRIPVTLLPGDDDPVAAAVEGVWSDADGTPLPDGTDASTDFGLVMQVTEGPDHCGWTSVTFMNLGWPLGTQTEPPGDFRQYVRDPDGVLSTSVRTPFGSDDELPADVAPSGFGRGDWELWTAPSDVADAVYVVNGDPRAGGTWERWPRAVDIIGCD